MNSKIKVLLADDHQVILDGMRMFLDHEPDIEVVGTALDGIEVMEQLQSLEVDILVLDLSMPRMNGLETLQQLSLAYPNIKTVILSFYLEGEKIHEVMAAGVRGYVVKNRGGKDLVQAIHTIMRGEVFFPSDIMQTYTQYLAKQPEKNLTPTASLDPPTAQQQKVMACILAGMTSQQIGDKLCIAPTTVETHKKNIREKYGLINNAQIASFAQTLGIAPWKDTAKRS